MVFVTRLLPLFLFVALSVGCQRPRPRALTKEQARRVAEAILDEAPTPQHAFGVPFHLPGGSGTPALELLGLDLNRQVAKPGGTLELTWYWKVHTPLPRGWQVFVHFDGKGRRESFDHDLVEGLLPLEQVQAGQIIRDTQKLTVPKNFPLGPVQIWVGAFDTIAAKQRRPNDRLLIPETDFRTSDDRSRLWAAHVEVNETGAVRSQAAAPPIKKVRPTYAAQRRTGDITIDGKLDDEAWQGVPYFTDFVRPSDGRALAAEDRPRARMIWDDTHLYVSVFVPDAKIDSPFQGRDSKLWEADVVEIYLDPGADGEDYVELQIAPTGEIFDAHFRTRRQPRWEEAAKFDIDMQVGVQIDGRASGADVDRSWQIEVAIPFDGLPGLSGPPAVNEQWAINLYRLDQRFHAAWSEVGRDYHNLPSFGTLVFTDPSSAPAPRRRLQRSPTP